MTVRFFLLAVVPAIVTGQGGAVVEGRVTDSVTHAGIAGAQVTVQSAALPRGPVYTATTDDTGAFRLEGIGPDGDFRAYFNKPGYWIDGVRGVFHATAANGPAQLQGELTPLPRLSGKVLDGHGHPVEGATLQLILVGGGGGPRVTSAKDGAFVFEGSLLPGSFTLRAVPPPKLSPPTQTGDEAQVWAPTYYPGATARWQAERIVLRTGHDLDNYDIRLRAVPVFHVRGVVVDESGKPISGATVTLVSPDSLDPRSHAPFDEPAGKTESKPDGTFEIPVRPGEWHLEAHGKRNGKAVSAVLSGTVSQGDWADVKLQLAAPFSVKGSVERPDLRSPAAHHTWVGLMPAWQTRIMAIHDETGAFEIDDVVPGRYRIVLEEPPPGSYLETVQLGGRDVVGQTVDVMDGSLALRVVYKTNGGGVQGKAEGCGGVVLLPKERVRQSNEFVHWGRCDGSGHFGVVNLRPGDYSAAAFDRVDDMAIYYGGVTDEALISLIAARGDSVRVEAGQSTTVTLRSTSWPER